MNRVTIVAFAFFCTLCYFASCLAFTYDDCNSKLGKFTEVSISGCHTSDDRCTLVRGTNASLSFKFTPNKNISQVNVYIYGIKFFFSIPIAFDKSDACKDPDNEIDCPLHENKEYNYTTTMFMLETIPSVNAYINWLLVNEEDKAIVCIGFPVTIE